MKFEDIGADPNYVCSTEQQATLAKWKPLIDQLLFIRDSIPNGTPEWWEAEHALGKASKDAAYEYAAQRMGYYIVSESA